MSSCRVFQTRRPATVKAPTDESLTDGTSRQLVPAERNAQIDNRNEWTQIPRGRSSVKSRRFIAVFFAKSVSENLKIDLRG